VIVLLAFDVERQIPRVKIEFQVERRDQKDRIVAHQRAIAGIEFLFVVITNHLDPEAGLVEATRMNPGKEGIGEPVDPVARDKPMRASVPPFFILVE
jgi:hypothetical protein